MSCLKTVVLSCAMILYAPPAYAQVLLSPLPVYSHGVSTAPALPREQTALGLELRLRDGKIEAVRSQRGQYRVLEQRIDAALERARLKR